MSAFEAGDVVCLRSGGPKMVVTGSYAREGADDCCIVWWHDDARILSGNVSAPALRLVESAKPEERLPVYEVIRDWCEKYRDDRGTIGTTLSRAILALLKEHGL